MNHALLSLLTSGLVVTACSAPHDARREPPTASESSSGARSDAPTATVYPAARRDTLVENYGTTPIPDPYRWLEDPDAPETRTWIEAQNRLTRSWIDAVPERAAIETRLTQLWNYERYGVPFKKGGRYFFTKNDGLQNQAVLFTADALDGHARVLLDPNTLRSDGTVAVTDLRPSRDGRILAYQLSEGGSDWTTIRLRDVATGRDLDDVIEWVKFSGVAWTPDSKGFYYSTYPEHDTTGRVALANHRLLYHELGTPQAKDVVVYARPDQPEWGFGGWVSDDGQMLVVTQTEGTEQKNRVFVADLRAQPLVFRPVFDRFDAEYDVLGKKGDRLWFRTDAGAANGRIVAVDVGRTPVNEYTVIVPEAHETVESAAMAGDRIVVTYLKDAANVLRVFQPNGAAWDEVRLPPLGSVSLFHGEMDDDEAFLAFTSFTTPTEIWRYEVSTRRSRVWRAPKVAFDPRDYVTEQVFFASKDGTKVPMFVTRRADVVLSPSTPVFLYGYGGFNVAIKPGFSPANLVWMERGGAYLSVNLRGGSEYGREWHESGTKERKQNVFDDFVSAAEYLIAKGWTSPAKLAIHGRSNGGLLVGACMTQRPELFGAALPGVGVLDMLRYHKFTIGWAWASDYGRSDDPEALPYLLRYSPVHNVKPGVRYPATLITTGDHDDRVVPAHSFKFAATLQDAQGRLAGAPPVLIRVETRGGHGAGKPTSMQIEELADQMAFLTRALSITALAPPGR